MLWIARLLRSRRARRLRLRPEPDRLSANVVPLRTRTKPVAISLCYPDDKLTLMISIDVLASELAYDRVRAIDDAVRRGGEMIRGQLAATTVIGEPARE
jgi:hypothetical protein